MYIVYTKRFPPCEPLRRKHRMRLPDAIIRASAQTRDMLLITRKTKDFPAGDPSVRAPYQL